jgi:hypothetical protein
MLGAAESDLLLGQFSRMKRARRCLALLCAVPIAPSSAASADVMRTFDLECAYERAFDIASKSIVAETGQFSAWIEFTDNAVSKVVSSKGSHCDPRLAFVDEMEVGFACGINLAAQRITYTFTFDKSSGSFEQRFFFGRQLSRIRYGRCNAKN